MLRTIFVFILIVLGIRYSLKGAFYLLLFYLWIAYFRPDAWIFTDGKLIFGHWSRPDVNKPATFTDAGGQPVLLTPGRTWIELAEAGTTNVTYG